MDFEYHDFNSNLLQAYFFDLSKDNEIACGYDRQGLAWRGQELAEMRMKGLIVKECPCKHVFLKNLKSLLGYIQECFDGTWLAHSVYYPPNMDGMEVTGFINEFYAVRYLHQVAFAKYPQELGDPPCLPWEQAEKEPLPPIT